MKQTLNNLQVVLYIEQLITHMTIMDLPTGMLTIAPTPGMVHTTHCPTIDYY